MRKILFLISVLFLTCGEPPKRLPCEVYAQHAKIYIKPFQNISTIELSDGFPRDSVRIKILFQEIEKAHIAMVSEIRLNGKRGYYQVVGKDEYPTMVVTPVLMPYTLKNDTFSLPIFLNIEDLERRIKYKEEFNVIVSYSKKNLDENKYHFWAVLLASWRRSVPNKDIASLFFNNKR